MKTLLAAVLIFPLAIFAQTHQPTDCALAWDYDDAIPIDGFKLYTDGVQTWQGADKTVSCVDAGLTEPGTYSVHVTAYNAVNESGPSNTLELPMVTKPPAVPFNLRITVIVELNP